jgi:hypothetical protein
MTLRVIGGSKKESFPKRVDCEKIGELLKDTKAYVIVAIDGDNSIVSGWNVGDEVYALTGAVESLKQQILNDFVEW